MPDRGPELVGVYIRVSMAREEMISPELQQRDVDAYLNRMSDQNGRQWRTVTVEQDLDVSGRSFAREGIQRLMTLMRQGGITTIVTYRYDRFGRNLKQALEHLEEVERLGGKVVSVTEPFDAETAIGHFMRNQTLAMAELQSKQIGEGWKRVQAKRIADGLPTNGRERYGYLAHRTTLQRSDGAWRLCPQGCDAGRCQTGFVPDPETGPVVQRIYTEYIGGRGFQAIAHGLNRDGLDCPGVVAARRSGNPKRIAKMSTARWTAGSVIDLADSGFAAGLVSHRQRWSTGAHEPLIDQDTWQAYQRRREAQRFVPTKARSPRWSLAGLAVCDECGGPLYATSSPRGQQYALYCGDARVSGTCPGVYRTRQAVEAAVQLWLQQYAEQLEASTQQALATAPPPTRSTQEAERRRLMKTLETTQTRIERLLDAYTDGAVDLIQYKTRRDAIQQEADLAAARVAQLEAPPPPPPGTSQIATFAQMWGSLSVETRRDVSTALLERVRVRRDKTVLLQPRWGAPVIVTFTRRHTHPDRLLPADAGSASTDKRALTLSGTTSP